MESSCKYRWLLARSPAHCSPPAVGPGSQQARDQYHGLRVGDPCLKEAEWWDMRLAHHCWPVGGSHEPRSASGVHELVMVSHSQRCHNPAFRPLRPIFEFDLQNCKVTSFFFF
ncbi:unnamed protein product [Rangifer tarandus platyrhynchus]|uniref:Uncharacterized protein n=1 Tax=Rangifer tarandus platyrhynchus TaxID=3082113 RepID=A0ABN8ZFH3_RANTA|nr:unnamed protein product [Rangifer tarandus platyrhynchus]